MARVDLTEPFAIRNARKQVRESLMMHGEEVISLRMYHVSVDEGIQPRCPVCFDDVYKQGDSANCSACFGTTFEGGIKQLSRSWALFTTNTNDEEVKKQGHWQSVSRQVQLEYEPKMWENDFLLRVEKWSQDHRPLIFGGAYTLGPVQEESLRTGNQYAQTDNDRVGQRAPANEQAPQHPIYHVISRKIVSPDFSVERIDGLNR